ncbi:MAG: hypothetical protein AB7G08_28295 [Hyphomicrobiaceae bacterium]
MRTLFSRIAGLGLHKRVMPTPERCEVGVLVPVCVVPDQVGDDPDVQLRRRWKEDCRSYRLRLQLHCQEEVLRKEKYEKFLHVLIETERT